MTNNISFASSSDLIYNPKKNTKEKNFGPIEAPKPSSFYLKAFFQNEEVLSEFESQLKKRPYDLPLWKGMFRIIGRLPKDEFDKEYFKLSRLASETSGLLARKLQIFVNESYFLTGRIDSPLSSFSMKTPEEFISCAYYEAIRIKSSNIDDSKAIKHVFTLANTALQFSFNEKLLICGFTSAIFLEFLGNPKTARKNLISYREIYDSNWQTSYMNILHLIRQKRPKLAQKILSEALKKTPKSSLLNSLKLSQSQFNSLKAFWKLKDSFPYSSKISIEVVLLYLDENKTRKAASLLKNLQKNDPKNPLPWLISYLLLSREIDLSPNNPKLQLQLEKLVYDCKLNNETLSTIKLKNTLKDAKLASLLYRCRVSSLQNLVPKLKKIIDKGLFKKRLGDTELSKKLLISFIEEKISLEKLLENYHLPRKDLILYFRHPITPRGKLDHMLRDLYDIEQENQHELNQK